MPEDDIRKIDLPTFLRSFKIGTDGQYDFFLGSGSSVQAGIKTGAQLVWDFKKEIYCTETNTASEQFEDLSVEKKDILQNYFDSKNRYPSRDSPDEYSIYFKKCYEDLKNRKKFIQRIVENIRPSKGHLCLGELIIKNKVKSIWTTNFDELIESGVRTLDPNRSISIYSTINANTIDFSESDRYPCIIKLHGDFRYDKLKNTSEELQKLETDLSDFFTKKLSSKALIVIGYSGSDNSIMSIFEKNISNQNFLPNGLFWLVHKNSDIPSRVLALMETACNINSQSGILEIEGFDEFLISIYKIMGYEYELINNIFPGCFPNDSPIKPKIESDTNNSSKFSIKSVITDSNQHKECDSTGIEVKKSVPANANAKKIDTNDVEFKGKICKRKKQILNINQESVYENALLINNDETITGKHVLQNFILEQIQNCEWPDFKNVYVKGVAGTGKSTEMKLAYNAVLDEFPDKKNYGKYQFCPVPYFFELKNYQENFFTVQNKDDYFILFLDGLDELSDSKTMSLVKYLSNLNNQYPNIRFIISGRDASFITEINSLQGHIDIKLLPYINENDAELRNLILKYKGTPLEELVKIPFYRNFALSEKAQGLKTYKDFFDVLIMTKLKDDKIRHNWADDISERSKDHSKIDIPHIQEKLVQFCHTLFLKNRRIFTESDLKEFIGNTTDSLFILESSLIDYSDKNTISFISNIYFEYFVAKYYSLQKASVIFKDLFLSSGRVKVQNLNIITVLLNLLSAASDTYKKITKKLREETQAYILLTDFENLTVKQRYNYYCNIAAEYNSEHKQIYYGRFFPTQDILANIDSLSDKLISLLSDTYKTNAVEMHVLQVQDFLKNSDGNKLVEFSNAVILLGVGGRRIWNEEQQKILKPIAVPLLKFFLTHPFADKLRGLLSYDTVLAWYETYGWADDWNTDNWNDFVRTFVPESETDFYTFTSDNDFRFKLKLFIHFYTNPVIWKLFVPSVIRILSDNQESRISSFEASFVPDKIDDTYETPTLHFDNDIFYVTQIFKISNVDLNDIISVLVAAIGQSKTLSSLSYESQELLNALLSKLKVQLPQITVDKAGQFYEILKNLIENDSDLYLQKLDQYIAVFPDTIKTAVFKMLAADLTADRYAKNYYIGATIYNLLNIKNKGEAEALFESLNTSATEVIFREVVCEAYSRRIKDHILYEKAAQLYPVYYADAIQAEQDKKKRLDSFEKQKQAMLQEEYNIITNKDAFIGEVKKVFGFIDAHPDFSPEGNERGKFIALESDSIGGKIRYDYNNEYTQPPLFSEFVIKILFDHFRNDGTKINRTEFIQYIEEWFSRKEYYWRFFFWLYICHSSKEETDTLLAAHADIGERIKETMQQEVSGLIKLQDIQSYDGGRNRGWVVPFVNYISLLYGNKLPEWFDRSRIINFIAYPAWSLATDYSFHLNVEFKWEGWNSVFDWIETIAGTEKNVLIEKAFEILPDLKSEPSRTQIITFFIGQLDFQIEYKKRILDAVISESLNELDKEYPDTQNLSNMNCNTLSEFWRRNKENVIDKIKDRLPFGKYNPRDTNCCRKEMIEYFCRAADKSQKKTVINLLKTKAPDDNRRILLAKLGDTDTVLSNLDALLSGKELDTSLFFGVTRGNTKLLKKYIQLFTYSYEKSNDRRQYLSDIARAGIKGTVTKKNFSVLRRQFLRLISLKKKKNEYFEYIQDFLNEVEQSVFSN